MPAQMKPIYRATQEEKQEMDGAVNEYLLDLEDEGSELCYSIGQQHSYCKNAAGHWVVSNRGAYTVTIAGPEGNYSGTFYRFTCPDCGTTSIQLVWTWGHSVCCGYAIEEEEYWEQAA